ncbi:MAG: methyltransferase domain-containing protein [bacterium]|nr:methyltransferase domain-containing protein [bacterium]
MRLDQKIYSLTNFNFHLQNINKELRLLKKFLLDNKVYAGSLIDIGCGDGYVTKELSDFLKIKNIYGLDVNKKLLNKAEKKGIKVIHANIDYYSPMERYDLVIIYGAVHHIKDTEKLIIKAKTMSKNYILIVDSTVRNNFFHKILGSKYFPLDATPYNIRTKEEILKALETQGCRILDEKTDFYANYWHDRSFILASVSKSS